jgi:hypothetical protein
MTKTKRLKQMYSDLKNGFIVCCNGCKIWMDEAAERSSNGRYKTFIYWEHYGRAANECSLSDLRWICKTIAKSSDYEYTKFVPLY